MPELPEVETIKRGIMSLCGKHITDVVIRNDKLRYPITENFNSLIVNQTIQNIQRRAKYLILHLNNGQVIIHLGMSGSISLIEDKNKPLLKHDHIDIICNNHILRYNDPRRFGCIIYTNDYTTHSLFKNLGPEPLTEQFNSEYLAIQIKNKKSTIKQSIMENNVVVGVGNIYASEALFIAKISPLRLANSLSLTEITLLIDSIKFILHNAIQLGGSSLKDYKHADGSLGYFQSSHQVYGKTGKTCTVCSDVILEKRLGQRNSFYCPTCQK